MTHSISGTPTGSSGESRERADWFEDLVAPIERFIEASTEEARSIGGGLRRTFSTERMEQAFSTLRQRLRRETVPKSASEPMAADPLGDPALLLRAQVRARSSAHTIEQWDRHLCDPPVIDL